MPVIIPFKLLPHTEPFEVGTIIAAPVDLYGHGHVFELRGEYLHEYLDEVRLVGQVLREVLVLAHAAETHQQNVPQKTPLRVSQQHTLVLEVVDKDLEGQTHSVRMAATHDVGTLTREEDLHEVWLISHLV